MMINNTKRSIAPNPRIPPKYWGVMPTLSQHRNLNLTKISYTKRRDHVSWTITYPSLLNSPWLNTKQPDGISIGRKYMFVIKLIFIDLKSGKSRSEAKYEYKMCDSQSIFDYKTKDSLIDFYEEVQVKVQIGLEQYNTEDVEFDCLQIMAWDIGLSIKPDSDRVLTDINNDKLNNAHKGDFVIPIKISPYIIGDALKVDYDEQGYVNKIHTSINKEYNLVDLILDKKRLSRIVNDSRWDKFDKGWRFYNISLHKQDFVLGIYNYKPNVTEKVLFTNTGSILYDVTDFYNDKGEFITRVSGKKTIKGDDNGIHEISKSIDLKPIPIIRNKSYVHQFVPNTNIGSLDCETFKDTDNVNKIYAIGFKSNMDKKSELYHINDNGGDANKMVIECINNMMSPKYNNITFYCHNWGGYDAIFIIKILNEFNQKIQDKYKMTYYFRDNKIYKLRIQDVKDRNRKVTICDSYTILNSSLKDLCSSFDIEENKQHFPYKFVSRETLTYRGITPSMKYYNDISITDYNDLLSVKWNLYEESLKYLDNDIEILFKVMNKANNQLFNDYNVNISDKSTIAGLATKIFMKDHYNSNIPSINKSSVYSDIVKGYYGGITEVYIPYGEDLYYYDVNSLYPSVCLQPMPGVKNAKYIEYIDAQAKIKDLFGFFHCEVETPKDLYLGVLPLRNDKGLIFPLGNFSGWYFSEELKYAESLGYKLKILKGYSFEKEIDTFDSYVNRIYSIKNNPVNKTQKSVAKGLLNNLLGRFGISLYKPVTKIVTLSTFNKLLLKNRILDHKTISDDNILVTYYDNLDPTLVKASGLSLEELLKDHTTEYSKQSTTSIVISAAVTAYARIAMSKLKLDILKNEGKIYYSDTDSIITDKPLPNEIVSPNELGKLKLEHIIKKGIFISGKTYCFINDKDEYINKAKGLKSSSLGWDDYVDMLNNIPVTGEKSTSKANWEKGEVQITTANVKLSSDVYKKRTKIYENDKWVNTEALVVNTNDNQTINTNKNTPISMGITTNILYSDILGFLSIENFNKLINKINNFFKPKFSKIKNFMWDLAMVLLVLILHVIYWSFVLDDDFIVNGEGLDYEYEDDVETLNTSKDSVQNTEASIKGHGLLDDSLYDNEENNYDYSTPISDNITLQSNSDISTSDEESFYSMDQDSIYESEDDSLVVNRDDMYNSNDEIFINKIRSLESNISTKSIIIDPYNSNEFDPYKTYIKYELDENSHVTPNILVEHHDDQAITPIDATYKFTYKPVSIVRESFYKDDLNMTSECSNNESLLSSSDYSSAKSSVTEESDTNDADTIESIIDHY